MRSRQLAGALVLALATADPCASSDADLLHLKQLVCSSFAEAGCGGGVEADGDWPSQAVYVKNLLASLADPATCLNTSFAADTVAWLNTEQGDPGVGGGGFMWTWDGKLPARPPPDRSRPVTPPRSLTRPRSAPPRPAPPPRRAVFQRQYYDMPRKVRFALRARARLGCCDQAPSHAVPQSSSRPRAHHAMRTPTSLLPRAETSLATGSKARTRWGASAGPLPTCGRSLRQPWRWPTRQCVRRA